VPDEEIIPVYDRLREVGRFSRTVERVHRDEAARAPWREVYLQLSEGSPGLVAAITNRAEAQVVHLSPMYALLDMSRMLRPETSKAAIPLWDHCENSARAIFGHTFGDPAVDDLLVELRRRSEGMTRTEIRNYLVRNLRADEIDRALRVIAGHGHAIKHKDSETGGGR
jgi:hypothetical protein